MAIPGQEGPPLVYEEPETNGTMKTQRGTVRALPVRMPPEQAPRTYVAIQPAQAQINIRGTGWLLIGLVLLLVLKGK